MPFRSETPSEPADATAGSAAKVDLHVHSKYSDRPSDWFLRRIGAPESFVEPLDLYRTAKQRGLDFVTISDHNCIDGALEIAHLPDTFISNEVTTYFPEDGCKVHCLVSGITDRQFEDIQEVRHDIYERAPMPPRMRSPSLP
jgi:predicted metal-dependent phosphoesterase TrpH